jgi:hypothetical protein
MKKLRTDYIWGMPATICLESSVFPFSIQEHEDLKYTEL